VKWKSFRTSDIDAHIGARQSNTKGRVFQERGAAMKTQMLGNGFAVEVQDIDLTALNDDALNEFRDIWMQHKVAILHDQVIDDAALIEFTRRLGPLFVHVRDQYHAASHPEIMLVSNLKEDGRNLGSLGNGDLRWHTDQSYIPRPVFGTLLYGVEIPEDGGATWFCDLAAAYAAMPAALRAEVDGETASYSGLKPESTKKAPLRPDQVARIPDQRHPLVRTHPYLGHKSLYISPNHITQIGDKTPEETEAVLDCLVGWAERPDFTYRHEWRKNDIVIWDNASVMHRRDGFPSEQRRFLKRTGFHFPEALGVPY
jgi:taurine dioxygenase